MNGECSHCGAQLPDTGGFCLTCGQAIVQPAAQEELQKDDGNRRVWVIGGVAVAVVALLGIGSALMVGASGGTAEATGATAPEAMPPADTVTTPAGAGATAPPTTQAAAGQSWVPATSLPGGELPEPATVAPKTYDAPTSAATSISGQSSETIAMAIVDNYVDAINASDYREAYGYTSDTWQSNHSYSTFASGLDTTTISDLAVTDTTSDPTVSVRYRSTQSSSDSPNGATCLIWTLRFEFEDDGDGYRISKIKELSSPPYREC